MSLKTKQGFKYQGDDWWKWWVYIDGPENELDNINHVIYTLHKTFPNPVRKIKDRKSNFRLETSGWGIFRIFIKIVYYNGKEKLLYHDLELKYPSGMQNTK